MKIAVIGSREFDDYEKLKNTLSLFSKYNPEIVSGGARGADSLAEKYARENNLKLTVFEADWETYGKSAGYLRNVKIVENSDMVIAFWNGSSKGTHHSLEIAKKQKKLTLIVYF